MANYNLCIQRVEKYGDAISVLQSIRDAYGKMKIIQKLISRLATDQEFSDMFDAVMTSDGFDGTVFISQMLYNINQTISAWETNANYRDVLGLPPL